VLPAIERYDDHSLNPFEKQWTDHIDQNAGGLPILENRQATASTGIFG